jgi:predicted regulator of Ras-like GTPase activity (Roadblock/LC7/MglB family)
MRSKNAHDKSVNRLKGGEGNFDAILRYNFYSQNEVFTSGTRFVDELEGDVPGGCDRREVNVRYDMQPVEREEPSDRERVAIMEAKAKVGNEAKGSLQDSNAADLIGQFNQEQKTARLKFEHGGQQASVYLIDGSVVHAVLGDKMGDEVVFTVLGWEKGTFEVKTDIRTEVKTVTRSWPGLLLEGARLLDEGREAAGARAAVKTGSTTGVIDTAATGSKPLRPEEGSKMSELDDILKEMSREVTGYVASALVGMDGLNIASHTSDRSADPETISAQLTMLLKLVDQSVEKLGAGVIEDNLTTTENAFILMRFLPEKQYYLSLAANRKTGNLGNMRLISRIYAERLAKAMPR